MSTYIHIAEPCHENWDKMQPSEQGRHCLACCKTVVDFTDWNTPDIAAYLSDPANKKVCGRFYETQLDEPVPVETEEWLYRINSSRLSAVKKIAAIIIVVFGLMQSACYEPAVTMGVMAPPERQGAQGMVQGEPELQPAMLLGDTVLVSKNTAPDSVPVCRQDTSKKPPTKIGKVFIRK